MAHFVAADGDKSSGGQKRATGKLARNQRKRGEPHGRQTGASLSRSRWSKPSRWCKTTRAERGRRWQRRPEGTEMATSPRREWTPWMTSAEGRSLDNPKRGSPARERRTAWTGMCRESRHEGQEGKGRRHLTMAWSPQVRILEGPPRQRESVRHDKTTEDGGKPKARALHPGASPTGTIPPPRRPVAKQAAAAARSGGGRGGRHGSSEPGRTRDPWREDADGKLLRQQVVEALKTP